MIGLIRWFRKMIGIDDSGWDIFYLLVEAQRLVDICKKDNLTEKDKEAYMALAKCADEISEIYGI